MTPGPWKAIAQGGSSTVVSATEPPRNDTRIPAYGYKRELGYCIAYPFIDDDNSARYDFVSFAHDDAKAIAAVPDLIEALQRSLNWLSSYPGGNAVGCYDQARAALRKAGVE